VFDPRDPRSIPLMANLASKPIVILGNGPQIDRMQAAFWDRLNKIQAQADSELVVVGINRIGVAEACLKHRYKPDFLATVDQPMFRQKTKRDVLAEDSAKAAERQRQKNEMSVLKRTNPKAYEIWEASQAQVERLEEAQRVAGGAKAEQVMHPVTDAFLRSFVTCAGVSVRIVSQQATFFLKPNFIPGKDIVLNLDSSISGPPDRARMLFTTADWVVNWFARMGARQFYLYGVSMAEGGHCKVQGLTEDDDYSWSVPGRQSTCFKAWDTLKDEFPGLKLYNCDRKALFVKNGTMEYGTPPQLDHAHALLSDEECIARANAVIGAAAQIAPGLMEQIKRAKEESEIAKLRAQMEADKLRAAV
jgi:hypothetical protein